MPRGFHPKASSELPFYSEKDGPKDVASDYGGYVKILVMTLCFCNIDVHGGHLLRCENNLRGNHGKKVNFFLGS